MTDNSPTKNKYDREERTGKFGEDIIKFAKQLPQNVITKPLIFQLIEAATSVVSQKCLDSDYFFVGEPAEGLPYEKKYCKGFTET